MWSFKSLVGSVTKTMDGILQDAAAEAPNAQHQPPAAQHSREAQPEQRVSPPPSEDHVHRKHRSATPPAHEAPQAKKSGWWGGAWSSVGSVVHRAVTALDGEEEPSELDSLVHPGLSALPPDDFVVEVTTAINRMDAINEELSQTLREIKDEELEAQLLRLDDFEEMDDSWMELNDKITLMYQILADRLKSATVGVPPNQSAVSPLSEEQTQLISQLQRRLVDLRDLAVTGMEKAAVHKRLLADNQFEAILEEKKHRDNERQQRLMHQAETASAHQHQHHVDPTTPLDNATAELVTQELKQRRAIGDEWAQGFSYLEEVGSEIKGMMIQLKESLLELQADEASDRHGITSVEDEEASAMEAKSTALHVEAAFQANRAKQAAHRAKEAEFEETVRREQTEVRKSMEDNEAIARAHNVQEAERFLHAECSRFNELMSEAMEELAERERHRQLAENEERERAMEAMNRSYASAREAIEHEAHRYCDELLDDYISALDELRSTAASDRRTAEEQTEGRLLRQQEEYERGLAAERDALCADEAATRTDVTEEEDWCRDELHGLESNDRNAAIAAAKSRMAAEDAERERATAVEALNAAQHEERLAFEADALNDIHAIEDTALEGFATLRSELDDATARQADADAEAARIREAQHSEHRLAFDQEESTRRADLEQEEWSERDLMFTAERSDRTLTEEREADRLVAEQEAEAALATAAAFEKSVDATLSEEELGRSEIEQEESDAWQLLLTTSAGEAQEADHRYQQRLAEEADAMEQLREAAHVVERATFVGNEENERRVIFNDEVAAITELNQQQAEERLALEAGISAQQQAAALVDAELEGRKDVESAADAALEEMMVLASQEGELAQQRTQKREAAEADAIAQALVAAQAVEQADCIGSEETVRRLLENAEANARGELAAEFSNLAKLTQLQHQLNEAIQGLSNDEETTRDDLEFDEATHWDGVEGAETSERLEIEASLAASQAELDARAQAELRQQQDHIEREAELRSAIEQNETVEWTSLATLHSDCVEAATIAEQQRLAAAAQEAAEKELAAAVDYIAEEEGLQRNAIDDEANVAFGRITEEALQEKNDVQLREKQLLQEAEEALALKHHEARTELESQEANDRTEVVSSESSAFEALQSSEDTQRRSLVAELTERENERLAAELVEKQAMEQLVVEEEEERLRREIDYGQADALPTLAAAFDDLQAQLNEIRRREAEAAARVASGTTTPSATPNRQSAVSSPTHPSPSAHTDPSQCPHCDIIADDLAAHVKQCPKRRVKCKVCGESMLLSETKAHRAKGTCGAGLTPTPARAPAPAIETPAARRSTGDIEQEETMRRCTLHNDAVNFVFTAFSGWIEAVEQELREMQVANERNVRATLHGEYAAAKDMVDWNADGGSGWGGSPAGADQPPRRDDAEGGGGEDDWGSWS